MSTVRDSDPPAAPIMYLVSLRLYDDTYYRFTMAESMLATPEMTKLRGLARSRGYRVDCERLDTIESAEAYLDRLA